VFDHRLRLGVGSYDQPVSTLSGGNQQKVLLARWLLSKPRVLMFDDPTKGIDAGAKGELYTIIGDLTASGLGVIWSRRTSRGVTGARRCATTRRPPASPNVDSRSRSSNCGIHGGQAGHHRRPAPGDRRLDLDYVGYGIVALFVLTWVLAVVARKVVRIEERWTVITRPGLPMRPRRWAAFGRCPVRSQRSTRSVSTHREGGVLREVPVERTVQAQMFSA